MMRRIAVVLALVLAVAGCTATKASPRKDVVPPVVIMTLGDSITAGGQWPAETCRLITATAGAACTVADPSVSGSDCMYWPSRIAALLNQYHPDIVTMNCGTNDAPTATIYQEPQTTWSWRYTVEAIHSFNANTVIVPSFIQYSDPLIAFGWLLANEPQTNDNLYREITRHRAWFPGIADMQQIPATASYLADQRSAQYPIGLGIHPTDLGYHVMGRIEYDVIRTAPRFNWPAVSAPEPCDMYGHRLGYARPEYTPCPLPPGE